MEQKQPGPPAMRVSIVSVSRNQREHLKRLIEQHGPRVTGMSGFRDYDLTRDELPPDVLLVDLDQADDASLTRIERLLEQSNVPMLFNESMAVPTTPGPYRDDWVDNLVGKLYTLATHRNLAAKSSLSDRPRYAQTVGHTLPNVLIVAHSKTRRRVLQIILASQGIRDSTETSFDANFIAERIEDYDALVVDEHNVSPEEQSILRDLTAQTRVPVQVCNSSSIPYAALARRKWGIELAGKVIKISKLNPTSPAASVAIQAPLHVAADTPSHAFVALNGEHEWGNRLSAVLAQARTNLMHQASTAKVRMPSPLNASKTPAPSSAIAAPLASTSKAGESDDSTSGQEQPSLVPDRSNVTQVETHLAESKLNEASATLGIIATHESMKDSNATSSSRLNKPATAQVSTEAVSKQSDSTQRPRTASPTRLKKRAAPNDIIDATNVDSLPIPLPPNLRNSKTPEPPLAPLPEDARDSEIERFFDFDKELDISQSRHALGEGHILNSAIHDEILPWNIEDELTNPFNNHPTKKSTSGQTQNKQRSRWRDSLNGIRKKLPKIFH